MADGGVDVTLTDDITMTGGYIHVPFANDPTPLGPATPPSDILYSGALESISPSTTMGITTEAGKGEEDPGSGKLMRPEGRHHLVDIHGLAVFLRRSTRCLSCRNAFCLYVTGKISAQLAAVTQVKITCQKCNYTTSQTLSKPAGVPDNPSPQPSAPAPVPAPPPDTSTPPVPPPLPPSPYSQKPRHQTVIRLLKEETPATSELLLKGKEAPVKRVPSLPALLPLQPIEKVWVKEEEKLVSVPKQDIVAAEGDTVSGSLDPLLTDWCQLTGISASPVSSSSSSLRAFRHTNSNKGTPSSTLAATSAACRVSSSGLQQCGSPPTSGISLPNPRGKPQEPPDAVPTSTTIAHRHLSPQQEGNALSTAMPFSSPVNPALSVAANACPSVRSPSEGLFRVLSGTSTPCALPMTSSLLQNNVTATPNSPQLLQALEIKQKLERDLEESLRLVRRMIQLDPDASPSTRKKKKETRKPKECKESSMPPQVYGMPGDSVLGSLVPPQLYSTPGEALLGSLGPPRGIAGDLLGEGGDVGSGGSGSRRRRDRKKVTAGSAAKSRSNKKENPTKETPRAKTARSRKRGGGEDEEGNTRKRKRSTKTPSSQSSSEPQEASKEPATSPAPPQCPPQTERYQTAVEQALYDALKHSLHGGDDGGKEVSKARAEERQEKQCGEGDARHQEPHALSSRCCSGLSSTTPSINPDLLSLRSSLETWGQAHKLLEGYLAMKRQKKGAVEPPCSGLPQMSTLAQLIAAQQQGTVDPPPAAPPAAAAAGVREGPDASIPDHVLDTLKRNLSQLVQKNSLRLALRSLVRKNSSRTSKSRKYVKIRVGVGEDEEEAMTGRMSSGGGGEGEDDEGEEEEGLERRMATWRFHDLLSSDSDSDPEDGRLVIDTEH